MTSLTEWKVPPVNQPRPGDYSFDLDRALAAVVGWLAFGETLSGLDVVGMVLLALALALAKAGDQPAAKDI